MSLNWKIISFLAVVCVVGLAGLSLWQYRVLQDTAHRIDSFELALEKLEENEVDTAKAVARVLIQLDAINDNLGIKKNSGVDKDAAKENSASVGGGAPEFQLPMGCTPDVNCWVFNYVDVDQKVGSQKDFACGNLTYDKHKGTDFAIRDLIAMGSGVPVLAGAPGKVVGVRDGMSDVNFRNVDPKTIRKKECGNGVRIDHKNNWFTQYCHMRKGSIRVKKGDVVEGGQAIGLVGLSGKTEFPHLHFQVSQGKRIVDPFVGLKADAACGDKSGTLWDSTTRAFLPYQNSVIYSGGFSDSRPLADGVHKGLYRNAELKRDSLKLFLWFAIRNSRAKDQVKIQLFGPDGKIVGEASNEIEKRQVRDVRIFDVTSKGAWPSGIYKGEIVVTRNDNGRVVTMRASRKVTVK